MSCAYLAVAFFLVRGAVAQQNTSFHVTSIRTTTPRTSTVSNPSAQPLTPIYISTTGIDTSAPLVVQFSSSSAFSVSEQPIRITDDGTIVAAVPLYFDPRANSITQGTVSVVLKQGTLSTPPTIVEIQNLPSVSSYGTKLGEISHAFLVFTGMALGRHLNDYQAIQSLRSNTVDTKAAQAALDKVLKAVVLARTDIDKVSFNNSLILTSGKLTEGSPVQFDQHSLDLLDRVLGLYLTELSPVIGSESTNFPLSVNARRRWSPFQSLDIYRATSQSFTARDASSPTTLLNVLTKSSNATGILAAIRSNIAQDATAVDKWQAVVGGLGSFLSFFPGASTEIGLGLGAMVGIVSMAADISVEIADVHTMYTATDSATQSVAYDELHSTNGKLLLDTLQTEFALAAAGSGIGLLGSFGADLYKTLENGAPGVTFQGSSLVMNVMQFSFNKDLQVAADASLQQLLNPFSSVSKGIARITGTVDVPNSVSGIAGAPPLSGVNVASKVTIISNGNTFSTIADPDGNYELFIPLDTDPFVYADASLQIIDPVTNEVAKIIDLTSGESVNSQVIDLTGLTTEVPLQLPNIQVQVDCLKFAYACLDICDASWSGTGLDIGIWGGCRIACIKGYDTCTASTQVK